MGILANFRHWFDKRHSVLGSAQTTIEQMTRFNSLVRSDPKDIIRAIDDFNAGYLDPLARLIGDYEQRDDKMRVASIKMASAVSRCGWSVRPKKGFEEDPDAARQVEVLERFWSTVRVTSAFKRNERGGLALLKEQMMAAQSYGFSVHDLSWQSLANGEIAATFTHVPLWHFENRTGELRYIPMVGGWDGVEMKRGEWMVSTGDGVGVAAVVCACMKRLGLTNWLVFTDRCVLPLIHGKTSAAYGSDQFEKLKKALANINRLARIVTDQTTEINAIQMDGGKQNPFGPLIDWCDRAIVTLYRGGDLATISRPDAVGGLSQADEVDALEQRSCGRITETLNEQVSAFVVDYVLNQELKAEIVIEPVSKPDVDKDMAIDRHLASFGVKLSKADALSRYGRAEAAPDDPGDAMELVSGGVGSGGGGVAGGFGLPNEVRVAGLPRRSLGKGGTPLQNVEKALQNARSDLGVQVSPPALPPSQIAKKPPLPRSGSGASSPPDESTLETYFLDELIKSAVQGFDEAREEAHAEARRGGELANMREYKRERDGKFAEVDHPRDFKPGDNPDSVETQAAEIGKGKKAIERCLAERVDVPNAVSRGDVGLISLVYSTGGENPRGLVRFLERPEAKEHLAETLVRGKAKGPYQNGQKLNLKHGGYVATLRLTSDEKAGFPRNWVLTGWGPSDKSEGGNW